MIPLSAYLSAPPVIVKVFPDPVCPYAKIVPLYPSKQPSMTSFAIFSKTVSYLVSISNIPLNWKP